MANLMLGSKRDQAMQAILREEMVSYRDLLDPAFKKKCVERFLTEYPIDKDQKALAYFNMSYQNMIRFIPMEDVILDTIGESIKEQKVCQTVIDQMVNDIGITRGEIVDTDADDSDRLKNSYKHIASNQDTLLKAVGVKSKVTGNLMNAAAIIGKQQQGNENIEIAKHKNKILQEEGESMQDLIKLQMTEFANAKKQILDGSFKVKSKKPKDPDEEEFKAEVGE